MSRPEECCYRCAECAELTCASATCNNFDFYADPARTLCGWCAREADGIQVVA